MIVNFPLELLPNSNGNIFVNRCLLACMKDIVAEISKMSQKYRNISKHALCLRDCLCNVQQYFSSKYDSYV